MSKLKGKVAVVTGASKGIGAGIAKALAAEGASVVVNYASSKAGADDVVAAIKKAGGTAVAVQGDVSKAADAQAIIDAAVENYGRLDILAALIIRSYCIGKNSSWEPCSMQQLRPELLPCCPQPASRLCVSRDRSE